ncbi:hypothetical protein [Streptomyces sp. NPDC004685]
MASALTLTGAPVAETGHAQPAWLSRPYDTVGNWVNGQFQRDVFGRGSGCTPSCAGSADPGRTTGVPPSLWSAAAATRSSG